MEYVLEGEFIELNALLKLVGPFESGGQIKHIIMDELIAVDGHVETRRKCKLRVGQVVTSEEFGLEIKIVGPVKGA